VTEQSKFAGRKSFLMPVEDVFSIQGRGTVATGHIEQGVIRVNDHVEIVGIQPTRKAVVIGLEMFRKQVDRAEAGDTAGMLLSGLERTDIERGQVVAQPGSITAHTEFDAVVYPLTPFPKGYKPQFLFFERIEVTGSIEPGEGMETVTPGDHATMKVTLAQSMAMDEGLKFIIREGGRPVGAGEVMKILK